nr:NADH dehydrogenase subunit 2 [Kinnaridae sp.]
MKLNSQKYFFLIIMILSVMIMFSSNNWIYSWMMLEINFFFMIPFLSTNKIMTDQLMKFFIIQSISSSLLLFTVTFCSITENLIYQNILLMTSLSTKMGLMPFHFWLPSLINYSSWENCFLMFTLQKIPSSILFNQMLEINLLTFIMSVSLIIAPILSMKQSSTKKMMAYISISSLSWMLLSLNQSSWLFLFFMLIYSIISFNLIKSLKMNNLIFINQMNMNNLYKLNLIFSSLSMAGVPPFTGFLPKMMILQSLTKNNLFMLTMMILSSVLLTFTFFNFLSSKMLTTSLMKKKNYKFSKTKLFPTLFNLIFLSMLFFLKY